MTSAVTLLAAPTLTHAQIEAHSLTEECRRELLLIPEYTLFDWIEIEPLAEGGIAVRGAATPKAKAAVLARFRQLAGAQSLRDECETLSNGYSDVRMRFRLYSALFGANSALLRYATRAVPPIHIIVKQGCVTLKGEVAQLAESMLAAMRARNVRNVRSVKNELRVLPPKKAAAAA